MTKNHLWCKMSEMRRSIAHIIMLNQKEDTVNLLFVAVIIFTAFTCKKGMLFSILMSPLLD